jgi:hypothetical protein
MWVSQSREGEGKLRREICFILIPLTLIVSFAFPATADTIKNEGQGEGQKVLFQEDFSESELDMSRWKLTRDGDFNQMAVDLQRVEREGRDDHRLRLMANTLETSDPIKHLGIRSVERMDLSQLRAVSFDLDWNAQRNGCYLAAALYICPVESENPRKEKEWVKFEWTGVPPGKNIRTNVWAKANGGLKQLYTDWGSRDENGRPQGRTVAPGEHRIQLLFGDRGIRISVDSRQIFYAEHSLSFAAGYLYLQMSSGTNYPSREVYFDNINVTAAETR